METEIKYKHPPIIERIAVIHAELDEGVFVSKQQDWETQIQEDFPFNESISRWQVIAREGEDGLPDLSSIQPKLEIIPRFAKKKKEEGFDWSIRFPAGDFAMNMHSCPIQGSERNYGDLRSSFKKWITKWCSHFEVEHVKSINLLYCNALTPITVPTFFKDGSLMLGEIVRPFADIPGDFHSIVPPYSCEVNLQVDEQNSCNLSIRVDDFQSSEYGSGIGIKFEAKIGVSPEESLNPDEIMELLDTAHGHIINQFEAVFTDKAKQSFERIS